MHSLSSTVNNCRDSNNFPANPAVSDDIKVICALGTVVCPILDDFVTIAAVEVYDWFVNGKGVDDAQNRRLLQQDYLRR